MNRLTPDPGWLGSARDLLRAMREDWGLRADMLVFGAGVMVVGAYEDFAVNVPGNDEGCVGCVLLRPCVPSESKAATREP